MFARPTTNLDVMRAAALIQNPMIRAEKVTPQTVRPLNQEVTSAFTQAALPDEARDVQGMSGGVMKAERTAAETSHAP